MNKFIAVVTLAMVSLVAVADPQGDFNEKLSKGDYEGSLKVLKAWEKKEPNDPDMYVGYINYYIYRSSKSGLSIDDYNNAQGNRTDDQLTFTDPKTGKTYYFNNKTFYDMNDIKLALGYLDKGITEYPSRLDMQFGKIYILNEIDNYKDASEAAVKLLDTSIRVKNKWLWSGNKEMNEQDTFILEQMQDYTNIWYQSHRDDGLEAMRKVAEKQMELYPHHAWAYDNLALYYAMKKDPQKQIELLLESEKVDGNDPITVNNIANWYRLNNEKEKARTYYEKLLTMGDETARRNAQDRLKELEK